MVSLCPNHRLPGTEQLAKMDREQITVKDLCVAWPVVQSSVPYNQCHAIDVVQSTPCSQRHTISAVQSQTADASVCRFVFTPGSVDASLVANTPVARLLTVSASGCPQEELNHCAATRSVDLPGSVDRAFVLSCTFS